MKRNCDGQTDVNVVLPFRPRGNTGAPHVICVGKSDISRASVTVLPLKAKAKVRAKQRVTRKEKGKKLYTRLGLPLHHWQVGRRKARPKADQRERMAKERLA